MKTTLSTLLGTLALAVTQTAWADATLQARKAETSGFLGDYSALEKGEGDEALLRYIKPETDFSKYTRIRIEPIRIYADPDSALADLPRDDAQALVDYLDAAIRTELGPDYELVDEPAADAMTLRIALTEARGSRVVLDTISSVLPVGIAVSALKRMATGTPTGVGSARVEMELVDSLTHERLIAAVDERAGRKFSGDLKKWSKWQDARDAYDHWAKQLKTRLAELRARK